MKTNKLIVALCFLAAIFMAVSAHAVEGDFSGTYSLGNGVRINLFSPDFIMESMTERGEGGELYLNLPGRISYTLIEDVDDPSIANKGDGSFHPFDGAQVYEALEGVWLGGKIIDIELDIYILPRPRAYLPSSTSRGNIIFLSPGTSPISKEVAAYIVTHEFGHCFHNRFMPDSDVDHWNDYLSIRGVIGDPRYTPASPHPFRPHEIFAEDFRYLFGCPESGYPGTIENPELPLPDRVAGLADFFVSLLPGDVVLERAVETPGAGAIYSMPYPNPFNPATTITARFNDGLESRSVKLTVYRADGSLVRELFSGNVSGGEFSCDWDGRTANGAVSGSGVYFYMLQAGDQRSTGKLLLLR